MTRLFARRVRIAIGEVLIEDLRVTFKAKKTLRKDPNDCEVAIYNLAPEQRTALQKVGNPFVIEAGYGTDLRRVFSGTVRWGDSIREGADWVSKIQSGDGEQSFRFATVSAGFGKNTPLTSVFNTVSKATGLDVQGAINTVATRITEKFNQGYAAHGKASTEIDRLLKGRGLEWSIQDGKMQVLPIGQPVPGVAVLLNENSGLIGSPEHGSPSDKEKTAYLKIKCLLQAQIAPGSRVHVKSRSVDGEFRVEALTHEGDTHGQAFYTELELLPL